MIEVEFTRERFCSTLEEAGCIGLTDHPQINLFLLGKGDFLLTEIELDSLSRLQLAIDLEDNFGVELGQEFLDSFTTVDELYKGIYLEINSIR